MAEAAAGRTASAPVTGDDELAGGREVCDCQQRDERDARGAGRKRPVPVAGGNRHHAWVCERDRPAVPGPGREDELGGQPVEARQELLAGRVGDHRRAATPPAGTLYDELATTMVFVVSVVRRLDCASASIDTIERPRRRSRALPSSVPEHRCPAGPDTRPGASRSLRRSTQSGSRAAAGARARALRGRRERLVGTGDCAGPLRTTIRK